MGGFDASGGVVVTAPPRPENVDQLSSLYDGSRLGPDLNSFRGNRRSSKSVSGTRPPLSSSAGSRRNNTFGSNAEAGPSGTSGGSPASSTRTRGLKRRISTPNLSKRSLGPEDEPESVTAAAGVGEQDVSASPAGLTATKAFETRARSTSTSIVVPNQSLDTVESPTVPVVSKYSSSPNPYPVPSLPLPHLGQLPLPTPPPSWSSVTPLSPAREPSAPLDAPTSLLHSAYNAGEAVVLRAMGWAQSASSQTRSHVRRSSSRLSDSDSEKGLNGSEEEEDFDDDGRTPRRYWGWFADPSHGTRNDESGGSYFALPTTERPQSSGNVPSCLPTPALSTQSLSHRPEESRQRRRAQSLAAMADAGPADGWWVKVYRSVVAGAGAGKTAQVLREIGWTVALLAALFVFSFLILVYALQTMPITQLKSVPKSTTDLQLLSHEIRQYMASSNSGWWHTVLVLTYTGCWKHAWSVPGAVVLNILVGSVFEPLAALGLLTVITASGSLGAYLLSRPLAPLIGVLFPKPLALVRAALAPDSVPTPTGRESIRMTNLNETITPIQLSDNPSDLPLGAPEDRPNVWRRLLLMRAMGFVPWSGMNVACGVVGVDWRTFWLTTAAGSASWSYVTASVGNILSRLALPSSASAEGMEGESLTSLLRDPTLIAKLVFLTLLTVVPVLVKRRRAAVDSEESSDEDELVTPTTPELPSALGLETTNLTLDTSHKTLNPHRFDRNDSEPPSPLAVSLGAFTPTPHVFDLLSFGRGTLRQGVRVVTGSMRAVAGRAKRAVSGMM